jgi:predicted AAA+ superfamily ATPase
MVSSSPLPPFRRAVFATLLARLREPRRFLQVIAGPRQVGKTTLVRQADRDDRSGT